MIMREGWKGLSSRNTVSKLARLPAVSVATAVAEFAPGPLMDACHFTSPVVWSTLAAKASRLPLLGPMVVVPSVKLPR